MRFDLVGVRAFGTKGELLWRQRVRVAVWSGRGMTVSSFFAGRHMDPEHG